MRKQNYFWIIILIILIVILIFTSTTKVGKREVCFSSSCVEVAIADSSSERAQGLMFISELKDDEGMLFVFDENGKHSFWMKNTLIPLDMIWISEDFEVVHIEKAVPCEEDPCGIYVPEREAKYVLEVRAGWSERNGVGEGDLVEINHR